MRKKASDEKKKIVEQPEAVMQSEQLGQIDKGMNVELSKGDEATTSIVSPERRKTRLPIKHKKRWLILLSILIGIIVILGAVPYTRYKILGLFIKEKYTVFVLDSVTKTPVSGALVQIGNIKTKTDAHGQASATVPVGEEMVSINKQYYKAISNKAQVVLESSQNVLNLKMVATGRQVPVKVVNKINGQPVAGVTIRVLDTTAETDSKGMVTIVLPTKADMQQGTVSVNGYNTLKSPITVTSSVVPANTLSIVPSGHVYFLSNLSGKIDVVSANLDGSGRTTVLAGTGTETGESTALLASRSWKYLALQSRRDASTTAKIYLITTATNGVSVIDEGAGVSFQFIGWSGDNFVYTVSRPNALLNGTYPQVVLKAFNAATGRITTIDQTEVQLGGYNYSGTLATTLQASILNDSIFYAKFWSCSSYNVSSSALAGKTQEIIKTKPDGTGAQTIQTYDAAMYHSYQQRTGAPNEVYFRLGGVDAYGIQRPWAYNAYENGAIQTTTELNDSNFYSNTYPVHLLSPAADETFWSVPADGKYNLFTGNQSGDNAISVAKLSEYNTYGWFGEDYLLVSKSSSELYIMSKKGGAALKISDYYKSPQYFSYGGGYGGI